MTFAKLALDKFAVEWPLLSHNTKNFENLCLTDPNKGRPLYFFLKAFSINFNKPNLAHTNIHHKSAFTCFWAVLRVLRALRVLGVLLSRLFHLFWMVQLVRLVRFFWLAQLVRLILTFRLA